MNKIYIFGHKNPDTDSVTSSIALSYLKNQLGHDTVATVLGEINQETKFVLNYFNMKIPKYLNDVKLQMKDLNYHKDFSVNLYDSLFDTYEYMLNNNVTGVPIVDENNKFLSIVTAKNIAAHIINTSNNYLNTSYNNLLKVLKAEEITKFDDEIVGNILAATYRSTTFMDLVTLTPNDILIVGDRHSIIEAAVNKKVKLIIVVGNGLIKEEHINIAKENKVNIIKTSMDTFETAKTIGLCNYIKNLISNDRTYTFDQNDYYEDFIVKSSKLKFNNYPIIDKENNCKGLIRITEITEKHKKQVILVDHNEFEQSVDGLEEAEILEIVDHHKIGNISTTNPINFRNMSVGSTNTIIYFMYKENKIEIPSDIAGIMLSGVLSDTLCLTSPTTTDIDREVVNILSSIANINYEEFATEMFKEGTTLVGKSKDEIVLTDIKKFHNDDVTFAISQVFTLNYEEILTEKNEYVNILENINANKEYDFTILLVTDIMKNGSYVLFSDKAKSYLENAFNILDIYQGYYLDGCVSRKKQIVPQLMEVIL